MSLSAGGKLAHDRWNPAHRHWKPGADRWRITHAGWKLAHVGWKLAHVGWKIAHAGWKIAHAGWKIVHVSWNITHAGWSIAHVSWKIAHAGWKLAHAGWKIAHAGWKLTHARWNIAHADLQSPQNFLHSREMTFCVLMMDRNVFTSLRNVGAAPVSVSAAVTVLVPGYHRRTCRVLRGYGPSRPLAGQMLLSPESRRPCLPASISCRPRPRSGSGLRCR